MAGFTGAPPIVTDGLVFVVDAANYESYPGSGTTWSDLSGNGNNGTLKNGAAFNSTNIDGITFDKVDEYVEISNQIQFDYNEPFTLNTWVNSEDANNNQIINNENTSYRGYQLVISSTGPGQVWLSLRNAVSTNYISALTTNPVTSNTWVNITGTYDGSSNASGLTIYFNGVPQSVTNPGDNLTSTTISNEKTWIGYRRPNTQGPFNGKIAIVQIYNKELSSTEVAQNYNSLKSRFNL